MINLKEMNKDHLRKLVTLHHNIKKRCYYEKSINYHNYGGRGITLHEDWHNFQNFVNNVYTPDFSMDKTFDRIDNDKNYEPGNVRWSTTKEQARNKRNTCYVEFNGKRVTLAELCEEYQMNTSLVWKRIYVTHWDIIKALTTPSQGRNLK